MSIGGDVALLWFEKGAKQGLQDNRIFELLFSKVQHWALRQVLRGAVQLCANLIGTPDLGFLQQGDCTTHEIGQTSGPLLQNKTKLNQIGHQNSSIGT